MESAAQRAPGPVLTEITLTREGHLWVAREEETGIARQGETWEEALRCSTRRLRSTALKSATPLPTRISKPSVFTPTKPPDNLNEYRPGPCWPCPTRGMNDLGDIH